MPLIRLRQRALNQFTISSPGFKSPKINFSFEFVGCPGEKYLIVYLYRKVLQNNWPDQTVAELSILGVDNWIKASHLGYGKLYDSGVVVMFCEYVLILLKCGSLEMNASEVQR